MIQEEWRDIKGYEGKYQVSNIGRVKSLERLKKGKNNSNVLVKERILKPGIDSNTGYLYVILCKDGKQTTKKVHRLVAEGFIPNPENKGNIDHINTIRTDNRVSNLRWVTRIENNNNPKTRKHLSESKQGDKHPMYGKFGKEHHNSKQIIQYSIDGEFIREWDSMMDVQRELGIHTGNISNCCKGRHKTTGGYKWSYKQ